MTYRLLLIPSACALQALTGLHAQEPTKAAESAPPAAAETAPRSAAAVEVSAGNLPALSRFWPPFVELTEPVEIDADKTLRDNRRYVLVRIEPGKVVLDEGSQVYTVPLEKTNAIEATRAIAEGKSEKREPNLMGFLGRSVFWMTDDAHTNVDPYYLQSRKYWLFYYFDPKASDHKTLTEALETFYEDLGARRRGFEVIMMPLFEEPKDYRTYVEAHVFELPWLVIDDYMVHGVTRALHHNTEKTPSLVLVDPNGRVYWQSESPADDSAVSALKTFLGKET